MKSKIKRRIGILTFHFTKHNYGALLQTFASFTYLTSLGFEVKVINFVPQPSNFVKTVIDFIYSIKSGNFRFDAFRKKHLVLTKKYYTTDDLVETNKFFDIFYVGSDQIWRKSMSNELFINYFLGFVEKNKVKLSYAASFGSNYWEGNLFDTSTIKKLLEKFDFISVREKDGLEICKDIFNLRATVVLDPTLLLESKDYSILLKVKNEFSNVTEKFLGYYMLNDKNCTSNFAIFIENKFGMQFVNLYKFNFSILGIKIPQFRKVEAWLTGISKSTFIVTDSYHCVIFAILFEKQFVCIVNNERGISRINNLLVLLNLENRLKTEEEMKYYNPFSESINYEKVFERLNTMRKKSYSFLFQSLGISNN